MDPIVHGIEKSRTRLSNFHFTSLQVRDNVGLSDPAGSSRSGQKIKDNIGSMYYVKFI